MLAPYSKMKTSKIKTAKIADAVRTNGMAGEEVKEITGILKLGKWKHIPLIDQFKEFSDRLSIFHKN